MILIIIGLLTALCKWAWSASSAAKPADGRHPIELLEHAPNNYELASAISWLLPILGWFNRLEDSSNWAWLLGAKDNAQWWTPDAPLGWIFRVLNKVDWALYSLTGLRIVNMQRKDFLAKCAVLDKPAYKLCEGDNSAEGFRLMLDACEADHISATGRMMLNQLMNGWIDTRVAIDNYCRNHPDVTATQIRRPVIIIGCPRTASTFMHKLLAKDPALRKPLFWELAIPSPPPDPTTYDNDPRRELVSTGFKSFDSISQHFYTDVHKYHYFGVDEIEEDSVLVHYAGVLAMHGIAPVEVLPSWCKFVLSPMCATLWKHGTKKSLARVKALEQLELFERIEETIARVRQTHGRQMFDVHYDELMKNPMEIVGKCYEHFEVSTQEHADFLAAVGLSEIEVTERLRVAALPPAERAAALKAAGGSNGQNGLVNGLAKVNGAH
ncbi:hypothetical protein T492DRAFT_1013827 [Pavlovales sp. CCMP2436]|nr:hypothetical protein T492DRAFT_1013827 [Pavlovales sp. CCMP2436]